jgi:threonine/homoserine/homoserine lactone efflux protein
MTVTSALALAAVHVAEGMTWFAGLILLTSLARRWLDGAGARRVIDRVTGVVLLGFGLRLVTSP